MIEKSETRKRKVLQVHVSGSNVHRSEFLSEIAKEHDKTLSSVIASNIEDMCICEMLNLKISPAAHAALKNGDWESLTLLRLSNNVTVVGVSEQAYLSKYKDICQAMTDKICPSEFLETMAVNMADKTVSYK